MEHFDVKRVLDRVFNDYSEQMRLGIVTKAAHPGVTMEELKFLSGNLDGAAWLHQALDKTFREEFDD